MKAKHVFQVKRVYEEPSPQDGVRFLVDRLWPRGVRKEALADVRWLREVSPSPTLRAMFCHDAAKWEEFRRRYRVELKNNRAGWEPLMAAIKTSNVTLLFAAKEAEMNNASVLKEFLEEQEG